MRPTHLQFRSPKEKTAEYNHPVVTKEGTILLSTVCQKKHPTFSQSKRFSQYDDLAKPTGYRVGPGSYSPTRSEMGKTRIRGGHLYRSFHANKDVTNNGYIFIGHQMVFDNSFVLPSRRNKGKVQLSPTAIPPEFQTSTFQRISTASTPARAKISELSKRRLMSPHYTNSFF
jgi:hypothetical protein